MSPVLACLLGFALLAQSGYDEPRLIALARAAVEAEVTHRPAPKPAGTATAKPVFVTIEADGKVVGCRGSLVTRSRTLEEEVILAARSAAQHDPRYGPLKPDLLKRYKVTVTIVESEEPLSTVEGLLPSNGLVLEAGEAKGIVLPWEGKDPKVRLQWAYRKAGVPIGSPAILHKLIAQRFRG